MAFILYLKDSQHSVGPFNTASAAARYAEKVGISLSEKGEIIPLYNKHIHMFDILKLPLPNATAQVEE